MIEINISQNVYFSSSDPTADPTADPDAGPTELPLGLCFTADNDDFTLKPMFLTILPFMTLFQNRNVDKIA
jgi:hypothetical protein